jgi:hypothetical protein
MKLNFEKITSLLILLGISLVVVASHSNSQFDVRPTALALQVVDVQTYSDFDEFVISGEIGVDVSLKNGVMKIQGWVPATKGFLKLYSSNPPAGQVFVNQMGQYRPDVEKFKSDSQEPSSYRFSGIDFAIDSAIYGQIECVVWTDGETQSIIWMRSESKCDGQ